MSPLTRIYTFSSEAVWSFACGSQFEVFFGEKCSQTRSSLCRQKIPLQYCCHSLKITARKLDLSHARLEHHTRTPTHTHPSTSTHTSDTQCLVLLMLFAAHEIRLLCFQTETALFVHSIFLQSQHTHTSHGRTLLHSTHAHTRPNMINTITAQKVFITVLLVFLFFCTKDKIHQNL